MIDNVLNLDVLRAYAQTLSVLTTGTTSLGASGNTYTRSSGSFLDDGFKPGLEVSASGFSQGGNNAVTTVKGVSDLALTVSASLITESIQAGREIAVGFPELVAWEGVEFEPQIGRPYFLEQYFPGPSQQYTVGKTIGKLEFLPQYSLAVYVPGG
jgi:hypothetical protein